VTTLPACRLNVVELEPAGTVTVCCITTSAGIALKATTAPPPGATEESTIVQVEGTVGVTESGVQEKPFRPAWRVTVPPLVRVASASPVAPAATLLVSWSRDD
jgi:hypothetical protein